MQFFSSVFVCLDATCKDTQAISARDREHRRGESALTGAGLKVGTFAFLGVDVIHFKMHNILPWGQYRAGYDGFEDAVRPTKSDPDPALFRQEIASTTVFQRYRTIECRH